MICLFREPGRKVNCVSNTILTHKSRFHFLCFDSTVFCRFFSTSSPSLSKKEKLWKADKRNFLLARDQGGQSRTTCLLGLLIRTKDSLSIAHGH